MKSLTTMCHGLALSYTLRLVGKPFCVHKYAGFRIIAFIKISCDNIRVKPRKEQS